LFIEPHAADTNMLIAPGPQRKYEKIIAAAAKLKAIGIPNVKNTNNTANIRSG